MRLTARKPFDIHDGYRTSNTSESHDFNLIFMKKIYHSLLSGVMMASLALPSVAQQLPNAGFEEDWVDCRPWTSDNNSKTKGKTPNNWCISHVIGMGGTGATEVGDKLDEGHNGVAVRVVNNPNSVAKAQSVPGYLTLGKTWSTAQGFQAKNKDGGTFDGIDFTYKPDAIEFYYKQTRADNSEHPQVILYSWKGSWEQADVPGNISLSTPKKATMTDRDRAVLDKSLSGCQGGAVTPINDPVRIASLESTITNEDVTNEWTCFYSEIKYENPEYTPEKFNIIFSAGDYFGGSDVVKQGNELSVDDIRLVYFSRLKSISFGGNAVALEDGKYEYADVEGEYDAATMSYELLGQTAEIESQSYDEATRTLTVTVKNVDADRDGQTSHTYTFTFKAQETPVLTGDPYSGFLNVWLGSTKPDDMHIAVNSNSQIMIDHADNGTCTFALPDFSIIGINVGDIVIPNTTYTTDAAGNKTYSGSVTDLAVTEGDLAGLTLNVDVAGTITADNVINLDIKVVVPMMVEMFDEIPVTFTSAPWGAQTLSGKLNVSFMGNQICNNENKDVVIYPAGTDENGNTLYGFALNDFTIDLGEDTNLGDIVVINTVEEKDGKMIYSGHNPELSLAEGAIVADVVLDGEISERGAAKIIIDVVWEGISIPVTFTTYKVNSYELFNDESSETIQIGIDDFYQLVPNADNVTYTFDTNDVITITANHVIKPLTLGEVNVVATENTETATRAAGRTHSFKVQVLAGDNGTATTGIENVTVAPTAAQAEVYDLRGVRVNPDNLTPGLYIRRAGNKVEKFVVK